MMYAKSCYHKEHKWGQSPWASHRGIGSVEIKQCNNCLALKINQQLDYFNPTEPNNHGKVKSETIVEPPICPNDKELCKKEQDDN